MQSRRILVASLACGVLTLSACGAKATEGGGDNGDLKTDKGVTADAISLGVLTDQSGVFKQLGQGVVDGHQIWVDETNKAGGVCDRDIKLVIRDHGYKADAGVVAFQEIEPQVLGFMQILGSPINAALDAQIQQKKTTEVALSWSSFILKNPYIIIPGTTYDIEMINGLSYLLEQKKIAEGDTIGYIYLEGEYGENGLLGAEYFAKQHDIKLEKVKVLPTDADLRNVVTGLKGKGVKAIGLTSTPAQTLSVATVSAQLDLNVPIVGNNPTFAPAILTPETAPALKNYYQVASSVPYDADVPAAKEVAAAYGALDKSAVPNGGIPYGYAIGEIWGQILETACENKDMTRDGIRKAVEESTNIGTEDLVADLDFSKTGTPATREVYIAQPDLDSKGGVKPVGDLFVSEDAESYVAPEQK